MEAQVEELKAELLQLRVAKVAGGSSSRIAKINSTRKDIARVYTVLHAKQRANLREFYKNKKYVPLDLRPKQTRALRRALTPQEKNAKTLRQQKKEHGYRKVTYILKA